MARRRSLVVLVVCLATLGVALVAAAVLGPAWLVATIEREAQPFVGPRLGIDGPLSWQLWPRPALVINRLALSDDSGQVPVQVGSIEIRLDPEAWFAGRPPVDLVEIRGLELSLRREADGEWNFAGWFVPRPDGQGAGVLPFRRLAIVDSRVLLSAPGNELEFARIEFGLEAGPTQGAFELDVSGHASSPGSAALALDVDATASLQLGRDGARLERLRLALHGQAGEWLIEPALATAERISLDSGAAWGSGPLVVEFEARKPEAEWVARIGLDRFAASAGELDGHGLSLDLDGSLVPGRVRVKVGATDLHVEPGGWAIAALAAEAGFSGAGGAGSVAFSADAAGEGLPTDALFDVNISDGRASLPHPRARSERLALTFAGPMRIDPAKWSADGMFAGGFDQSLFELVWAWSSTPRSLLVARMSIDRLELDGYLPSDGPAASASGDFALPQWQDWPVAAELRVGTLEFRGMLSRDARLSINLDQMP